MVIRKGYNQTELGIIPEDWNVMKFQKICLILRGQVNPQKKPYRDMLHIGLANIEKFTGKLVDTKTSNEDNLISGKFLFSAKHVLYGKINPHFRKVVFPKYEGLCSADIYPIECNSDYLIPEFLFYYLLSENFTKTAVSFSKRSGIPKINRNQINLIDVALPSIPEQEKISQVLSDIDKLIDSLESLIQKKKNIKQGAMQELLTGKRRLEGFSGEWTTCELGKECQIITKGTTPTSIGKNFTKNGINFVKIESVSNSGHIINENLAFIDLETHNILKRSQLKENDVLFSIAGALGRTCIISKELLPANTNQALSVIRLKNPSNILVNFLFYYLNSDIISNQINTMYVQGAQSNLSLQNIYDFIISFPTIPEQTEISKILTDMSYEIQQLESQKEKYINLKQAMMQKLLTGEIRLV